jgi:hypothetical protein
LGGFAQVGAADTKKVAGIKRKSAQYHHRTYHFFSCPMVVYNQTVMINPAYRLSFKPTIPTITRFGALEYFLPPAIINFQVEGLILLYGNLKAVIETIPIWGKSIGHKNDGLTAIGMYLEIIHHGITGMTGHQPMPSPFPKREAVFLDIPSI